MCVAPGHDATSCSRRGWSRGEAGRSRRSRPEARLRRLRPFGWYCRYGPSVNPRELLVEEGGFIYGADAYNDAYFVQSYGSPVDFYDALRMGLDEYRAEGDHGFPKLMTIGLHPRSTGRWTGQATRAAGLRQLIEYALDKGDVWFASRIEIANWWLAHHEEWERG